MDFFRYKKCSSSHIKELVKQEITRVSSGLSSLPSITIALNNRCNSRCSTCNIWKTSSKKQISTNFIKTLISTLLDINTRRVTLTGGEPLLHTDFIDIVESFRNAGIDVHLMTNGIELEKFIDDLAMTVNEITVSLDSTTSKKYIEIRGVDAFDRVVNGIKLAISNGIVVRIRNIIQRANFSELPMMIEFAKKLNVECVTFQPVDVCSEYAYGRPIGVKNTGVEQSRIGLRVSDLKQFDDIIAETIRVFKMDMQNGFITESQSSFETMKKYFRAMLGVVDYPVSPCNLPCLSTIIDCEQSVRPCFFLPDFGKTNGKDFAELINCEKAIRARTDALSASKIACKRCVVKRFRDPHTLHLLSSITTDEEKSINYI